MALCNLCQQITPWSLKRLSFAGIVPPSPHLCNPHYKTLRLLETSASTCSLCHLFYTALLNSRIPATKDLDFDASVLLALSLNHYRDRKVMEPQLTELLLCCGDVFVRLNAVAEEWSKAAREGAVAGRMPSEAGGEEGFETVVTWFETCVRGHEVCRLGGEGDLVKEEEVVKLPHRVLDVKDVSGDEGVIRLVETENGDVERKGQYVALSHRWPVNPKEHFMTTRPVLEERKRVIKVEDMPANYRDAVVVTRRLGIRYLWIDSLCIVQDDARDWEREAALMGSYYHNSAVTIMAATNITRREDEVGGSRQEVEYSKNGFLSKRKRTKELVRVRLKYVDEEWRKTGDYWEVVDRGNSELVDRNMELLTRCWVMQEEMLPRRRIMYTPEQLLWVWALFPNISMLSVDLIYLFIF
jgi:hypothetical protein